MIDQNDTDLPPFHILILGLALSVIYNAKGIYALSHPTAQTHIMLPVFSVNVLCDCETPKF